MLGKTNAGGGGGGGGGGSLNFSVINYPALFPVTAKENTIGVITSTMTDWCLQADEPQSPVTGLVWVKLGTSSTTPISVSRKKTVMIYPISVKEWDGSAWVSLTARCYQNGAWKEWTTVVIENKIQMMVMTLSGNAAFDANGLKMKTDSNSKATIALNFDTINTLKVKMDVGITSGMGAVTSVFGVTDNPSWASADLASTNVKPATGGVHEFSVDTTHLTGTHYVIIYVSHSGSYQNYVTDLWGEP